MRESYYLMLLKLQVFCFFTDAGTYLSEWEITGDSKMNTLIETCPTELIQELS